jgi:hypothetical protein
MESDNRTVDPLTKQRPNKHYAHIDAEMHAHIDVDCRSYVTLAR